MGGYSSQTRHNEKKKQKKKKKTPVSIVLLIQIKPFLYKKIVSLELVSEYKGIYFQKPSG